MADRPDDFVTELNKIANELIETYKQAWSNRGYKPQNFPHKVIYNGQMFELQVTVPSYWSFVEYGQPPHEIYFKKRRDITRNGKKIGELMGPPISVLRDWLLIKKNVPGGEALKRAIMIDKKIAKNHGKQIDHPGSKGIELFESIINASDYVQRMTQEITRLLNIEIKEDLVIVFEGMENIKLV